MLKGVKTYTKINNDFIDDFFGFYNLNNKYNFAINLEDIAKWMNTKKIDIYIIYINFISYYNYNDILYIFSY